MRISIFPLTLFILIIACLQMVSALDHHSKDDSEKSKFYEPVKIDASKLVKGNKVKNAILFIGDGMGVSQVFAGMTANRGKLNIEYLKYIGFAKTQAYDNYITDSGAAATAMACGVKTYNGAIGLDPSYRSVTNLVELAEAKGMSTGLIATSSITHATPASFIAHQKSRHMHEEIASDFLKSNIDVVIGGGRKYFTDRSDEQSLIPLIKKNGYTVIKNVSRLSVKSENRLFALVSENALPRAQERKNYLELTTKTALNILSKNDNGFFLMIEGSQIDWAGHDNATDYVVAEMLDLDKAIGAALQFAAKDGRTLIICTADHETGGMAIESGNMETGEVEADFTSSSHTAVMVPVFSIGPNAEDFIGIYENNEIFFKIKHLLQL